MLGKAGCLCVSNTRGITVSGKPKGKLEMTLEQTQICMFICNVKNYYSFSGFLSKVSIIYALDFYKNENNSAFMSN